MASYTLVVNNRDYSVEADPDTPVLWILRDLLDLKGTKFGCGIGQCGACTIHFNGVAMRACSLTVSSATKGRILTIEGLSSDGTHILQKAWMESDVAQCGYCQAGQIMSAAALLSKNPVPTDADIDAAMSGNVCRCGTYSRIRQAIKLARKHANRNLQ
jgi:aerobic-type carbon monoxide dehydrogenase small subunit (CoxS/CutS family)